jgi:hypothetical protein
MVLEKCTQSTHQLTQFHFTHCTYGIYTDTDEGLDVTGE